MEISFLKLWLWPLLLLAALWWLVRGGRRSTSPYPQRVFLVALTLTVLVFGFALGSSPNPIDPLLDLARGGGSLAGKLLLLLYFSCFALLGTKLICGWGCPFGALQELLYEFPPRHRHAHRQLPFLATMAVRTLIFGAAFLVVAGWLGSNPGTVLYDPINPFRLFDFDFTLATVVASIVVFLGLAFFVYRPFCQLVCPFGWYSWFLERFSLFGIRINRRRCSRCSACAHACPLEAARGRLEGWPLAADCFSCARCLRVCPAAAIDYGPRWRRPESAGPSSAAPP
ncbi:MAG: 4Fe-4S binding protein [Desulfuromonadales bacterium]|nr:4Fe-4S binding protein [Desulfuromonadales bacterium]